MRSGTLRNLITIQEPTKVKSDSGAMVTTWSTFKQVWGGIRTLRGYEKQSAESSWSGADSKINIRYIPGLLSTMRISFNDVIYSIFDINDIDERHREVIFTCQSGVKAS